MKKAQVTSFASFFVADFLLVCLCSLFYNVVNSASYVPEELKGEVEKLFKELGF